MEASMKCVPGCMRFDGRETKHHRDCPYYPESLTKAWHDTEADYLRKIDRLRSALAEITVEAGTSTLTWKIANSALMANSVDYKMEASGE